MKKEVKKEHWPRLLKNSGKYNWLKADWGKWVDEDEEDAKPDFDGLGKHWSSTILRVKFFYWTMVQESIPAYIILFNIPEIY